MRERVYVALLLFLAAGACARGSGSAERPPSADGGGPDDPGGGQPADAGPPMQPGPTAGFVPDPQGTGPRVWLSAQLTDARHADLEIWAAELGPIFGYAGHVRFDADHLHLAQGATPPSTPSILAPDDASKAIELWTESTGDVGFGAVRTAPENGEITPASPVKLGVLQLEAAHAGRSTVGLERITVRRADGRFVEVTTSGGTLVTTEGGAS